MIAERFSSKLKDYRVQMLEKQLEAARQGADDEVLVTFAHEYNQQAESLAAKLDALFVANRGTEAMPDHQIELVKELAETNVQSYFSANVVTSHGYPMVKSFERKSRQAKLIDAWEKEYCFPGDPRKVQVLSP